MATPNTNQVFNGTYGTIWFNDELWGECDSFDANVNVDYEDINFSGKSGTYKKAVGWNGTGSMTIRKVNSRIQSLMAESIKAGRTPRFKIVGKLADPDVRGNQRIVLNDVTVDGFNLLKFDQKTTITEDISFAFSDYDLVSAIN